MNMMRKKTGDNCQQIKQKMIVITKVKKARLKLACTPPEPTTHLLESVVARNLICPS